MWSSFNANWEHFKTLHIPKTSVWRIRSNSMFAISSCSQVLAMMSYFVCTNFVLIVVDNVDGMMLSSNEWHCCLILYTLQFFLLSLMILSTSIARRRQPERTNYYLVYDAVMLNALCVSSWDMGSAGAVTMIRWNEMGKKQLQELALQIRFSMPHCSCVCHHTSFRCTQNVGTICSMLGYAYAHHSRRLRVDWRMFK